METDWAVVEQANRDCEKGECDEQFVMGLTFWADEHPEDYEGPCMCCLCRSYSD